MKPLEAWLLAAAAIALGGGLVLLAFGARLFIEGAAEGARRMRVSPLLVGMFLAGFATSMPEAVVAAVAAYSDSLELALGNAVGSNIANIGLVLGAAVLFMGLRPEKRAGWMNLGAMTAVTALACLLMLNGYLSRLDAIVLLAAMPIVTWLLVRTPGAGGDAPAATGDARAPRGTLARNVFYSLAGLLLLMLGAEVLVRGAKQAALLAGVGELVIGATIVAVGNQPAGARDHGRRGTQEGSGTRPGQRDRVQHIQPAGGDRRGRRDRALRFLAAIGDGACAHAGRIYRLVPVAGGPVQNPGKSRPGLVPQPVAALCPVPVPGYRPGRPAGLRVDPSGIIMPAYARIDTIH